MQVSRLGQNRQRSRLDVYLNRAAVGLSNLVIDVIVVPAAHLDARGTPRLQLRMAPVIVPPAAQIIRNQFAILGSGDHHRQQAIGGVCFIRQADARTD
jgi:hypothetical protein